MSEKLYSIVAVGADERTQPVGAGMTWQEALQSLEDSHVNIDFLLASLEYHKSATFHDTKGNLFEITVHTL